MIVYLALSHVNVLFERTISDGLRTRHSGQ